jgi:hypothetical protein
MRTIAGLLGVLASVSIGCVGTAAPEAPNEHVRGEPVGMATEDAKDADACSIALAEEAAACASAAGQAGLDPLSDVACVVAVAKAKHECR